MYTTRTKMLFNQLPGSIVFEQDSQQWTTPLEWNSEHFKPLTGAENAPFLLDRALSLVKQHPEYLRRPYADCNPTDFTLLQPSSAQLWIFPRMFECKKCRRLVGYRNPENTTRDNFFADGFYCKNCGRDTQFQQLSLVWTHHCGYMAQASVAPCKVADHNYKHLYIDRRGTQQPTEYVVRCMGPDGTFSKPKCGHEGKLLPGSGHSVKGCRLADEIEAGQSSPDAMKIASDLRDRTVRIRPAQDPANFYSVGLDVVNPTIQIPEGVHTKDEIINALLAAHIRGDSLASADLQQAFSASGQADERVLALTRVVRGFDAAVREMEASVQVDSKLRQILWKAQVTSAGLKHAPSSFEAAQNELQRGRAAVKGAIDILRRPDGTDRHDRAQLVDQLIEITHLTSQVSSFDGLEETASLLREHERDSAPEFIVASERAKRLGFVDIKTSSSFDIVRMQVGFVRNSFDVSKAQLSPFTERHQKRPIYARQSSTEAIMFVVDPVRLVKWVHEGWPDGDYQKLPHPADASPQEARKWLLEMIDYASCAGYDPIEHEPTRYVFGLLHTMSHLFMRESSAFSGVDASTMKELIYPALPGFIIYKAQHGDFSLGGLVTLYEDHLGRWIENVEAAAKDCPNDPICRTGRMRDTVESAACYGCLAGSELSCVHFNRDLDRATLEGTAPQRRKTHPFKGYWQA